MIDQHLGDRPLFLLHGRNRPLVGLEPQLESLLLHQRSRKRENVKEKRSGVRERSGAWARCLSSFSSAVPLLGSGTGAASFRGNTEDSRHQQAGDLLRILSIRSLFTGPVLEPVAAFDFQHLRRGSTTPNPKLRLRLAAPARPPATLARPGGLRGPSDPLARSGRSSPERSPPERGGAPPERGRGLKRGSRAWG